MTPCKIPRLSACAAALMLAALPALAQVNPFERGPAPTAASLEAAQGSYQIGESRIASQADFGGGTVYYPTGTSDGPFGLIAVAPGFIETQASNTYMAKKWASHGFVVVNINVKNIFEYPGPRAKELEAALKYVVAQAATSGSPYFGKVDASRLAVSGHSMGGGGTLEAARDNPQYKAAVPLAPWDLQKNFSGVTVPTLIVACETDFIAPVDTHAETFYNRLPASTDKAFIELKGKGHFCPNSLASTDEKRMVGKYTTAWFKRFVDNDTRFTPFLCGAPHAADLNNGLISRYQDNCPY